MKTKFILFLSLFCISIYGQKQTIFVQKSDGSIITINEIKNGNKILKIVNQDYSKLPGAANQKLGAINNPGSKILIPGSHIVYSPMGFNVSIYKDTRYIFSLDGETIKCETTSTFLSKELGFATIALYLYLIVAFYFLYKIDKDKNKDDVMDLSSRLMMVFGFVVGLFLDAYMLYTNLALATHQCGMLLLLPIICVSIFWWANIFLMAFQIPTTLFIIGTSMVIFIAVSAFWGILICIIASILGAVLGRYCHEYIDHIAQVIWDRIQEIKLI